MKYLLHLKFEVNTFCYFIFFQNFDLILIFIFQQKKSSAFKKCKIKTRKFFSFLFSKKNFTLRIDFRFFSHLLIFYLQLKKMLLFFLIENFYFLSNENQFFQNLDFSTYIYFKKFVVIHDFTKIIFFKI